MVLYIIGNSGILGTHVILSGIIGNSGPKSKLS